MWSTVKGYVYLAFVLGGLALLGGMYAKGRIEGAHKAELANLNATVEQLNRDIARWKLAYELDAKQAALDQKDADLDVSVIKETVDNVEEPDKPAIGSRDADRVRDFAERRDKTGSSPATKRP